MEYIWYVIAAAGAGIGTGFAGLSAATVMVPILIVLCPSFSGETGAYQATAIALASDILGSAVTTATYIRHKNIDLKRGWIMLVSILSMCTVGSFAAWVAGNVVLGSFTLILTFCIGIRFLIKPDTTRADTAGKGERLDRRGVAISLFFGLTIGFGTGFVGTGGGMMMLVVFTAFLGMELKTAVGTSTFIMTFTALIASVSHIVIHPAIVLEKWPVLLICIVVATVTSFLSARFANRVDNRTVGLVTGAVLTVLGGAMLLLNFREQIAKLPLLAGTLRSLGHFLTFVLPCIAALLVVHFGTRVPRFVFRKLLHIVAYLSVSVTILRSDDAWTAALAFAVIAVVIYPILRILEHEKWYRTLFVEKKDGEVRRSLLMLFFTVAAITAAAWGLFGQRETAVAAVLMWGVGDAAAALVGIPYGKHKVKWHLADPQKSHEGTAAMDVTAFLSGFAVLYGFAGLGFARACLSSLVTAAAAAVTELVSRDGVDTVTVPLVNVVCLLILCGVGRI